MTCSHAHSCQAHFHVSSGMTGIVVHMAGELDIAAAPVLADILDVLETPTAINVQLDASNLTFADAAFVRTVLDARRVFARDGGWVQVVDPSRCVSRLLRLVCMDQLLQPRWPPQRDALPGGHSGHGGEVERIEASSTLPQGPRVYWEGHLHSQSQRSSADVSARRNSRSHFTDTRGDRDSTQRRGIGSVRIQETCPERGA